MRILFYVLVKNLDMVYATFMLFLEYAIRFLLHTETSSFVGPAMASSGIGLVLPLIQKNSGQLSNLEGVKNKPPALHGSVSHMKYINVCLLIILTVFWLWALWISITYTRVFLWNMPIGVIPGYISYMVAVLFKDINEVLE